MNVPAGWHRKTIDELFSFTSGNGFRATDWSTEGLPIIRIQNLNGSKNFNYYNGKVLDKWLVEPGQLLFAWAGTQGVSFGPTIWRGPRGVLNQHIYKLTPKIDADEAWLFYALLWVTEKIEQKAHGFKSTLLHVHKSDITGQLVTVPPHGEQKAIGATLSIWDEAIQKTEELITAKETKHASLIREAYRKSDEQGVNAIFGDFLAQSAIPGTCGETAKKLTVKLYGKGVVRKEEKRAGSGKTKYYVRKSGQLIYSKLDFLNGAFGLIPEELDGFESTLDLPAFDVSPDVDPDWLLGYLSRREYYERQLGLARGQRKARRVHPSDFLSSPVRLPSIDLQRKISEAVTESTEEISLLRQLLIQYERQRLGLMSKLLTGEWRLNSIKEVA
ncbi:MAG: restriction endonuclease subunit S [Candidatus Thiodiazotropha sp.]